MSKLRVVTEDEDNVTILDTVTCLDIPVERILTQCLKDCVDLKQVFVIGHYAEDDTTGIWLSSGNIGESLLMLERAKSLLLRS